MLQTVGYWPSGKACASQQHDDLHEIGRSIRSYSTFCHNFDSSPQNLVLAILRTSCLDFGAPASVISAGTAVPVYRAIGGY